MVNDSIDNLRLDINKPKARASISVRKGDTKTRTIHISLVSNGAVYSLEDALMAELLITKPDGNVCDQDMVIKGNELQYTFRTQDTNVAGECVCQIRLTFKDGARLTSPQFYMYVYNMILDQNTSKSENEYSQTDSLLVQANAYYENATELANTVEGHVNDAIDAAAAAEDAKSVVETYSNSAKQYAEDAEAAQTAAETAQTAAETAQTAAEAAQAAAEAAANNAAAVNNAIPATTTTIGLVKPDGTTITVDSDGTIHAEKETAAQTSFDNSTNGMTATNVQAAIEELKAGSVNVALATTTTAGTVKPDGTTITVDGNGVISAVKETATQTSFDNSSNGMTATNVQDAIEELKASGGSNVSIATTTTVGTVKPDGTTITVDSNGVITAVKETAADTSYSNATSGLTASTVQGAIDEVSSNFQVGVNQIITSINTKNGANPGDANYLDGTNTPTQIANAITNINTNANAPASAILTDDGNLTVKDSSGNNVYADSFTNSYDKGASDSQTEYEPDSATLSDAGVLSVKNAAGTEKYTDTFVNCYDKGVSDTKVGDALDTDVLTGKTFTNSNGVGITGAMVNNRAVTATLDTTTTSYTVPAGYHDGNGTVSIDTQTKTVTPTDSVQTVSPDAGKVLSSVTVNAATISTETKTAIPTTADQTVIPSDGKYFSSVTVKGVSVPAAANILTGSSVTSGGTTLIAGSMTDKSNTLSTVTTLVAGTTNDETYTSFYMPDDAHYDTTSEIKIENDALIAINSNLGSTGPIYNWSTWVEKGNLSASSYSSLTSLFADEKAVRQLMTIHASCDYLLEWYNADNTMISDFIANANTMKWIGLRDYICDKLMAIDSVKTAMLKSDNWEYILKDKVPVMTSNTAPYGEASTSSLYSSTYDAFKVFDESSTTRWSTAINVVANAHVQYKFSNPICVRKIKVHPVYDNSKQYVTSYKILGSNDGTFTDYPTPIYTGTFSGNVGEVYREFDNDNYYMYYRFVVVSGDWDTTGLYSLQFYGRSLNVSVPKMEGNTAPWGEVIYKAYYGSIYPYFCFDSSDTTEGSGNSSSNKSGAYIGFDFKKKTKVNALRMKSSTNATITIKLQGSNESTISDSTEWSDIYSYDLSAKADVLLQIDNVKDYKCYRLYQDTSSTNNIFAFYTLQFYCVDYSEREFEADSTMKYIYDHGVELETVTAYSSSGTITKNDDNIYMYSSTLAEMHIYSSSINLTNYSLARIIIGDEYNEKVVLNVGDSAPILYSSGLRIITSDDLPNNAYLDISSFSGDYYCGIKQNTANAKIKLTEWWLE